MTPVSTQDATQKLRAHNMPHQHFVSLVIKNRW